MYVIYSITQMSQHFQCDMRMNIDYSNSPYLHLYFPYLYM